MAVALDFQVFLAKNVKEVVVVAAQNNKQNVEMACSANQEH